MLSDFSRKSSKVLGIDGAFSVGATISLQKPASFKASVVDLPKVAINRLYDCCHRKHVVFCKEYISEDKMQ